MANTPLTSSLIVIAQNYAGDVVRQINRTSILLKILAQIGFREAEGANAAWVAEGSGAVAESFAEGATTANFGSDTQTGATITMGRYWAPFNVTGTAMVNAASSRTPAGNIQLWARQMVNASEALAKLLNTDLYVGTGANKLIGLDKAIATTNNTYATIDRTDGTKSFWIPYTATDVLPISFSLIRTDLAAIKVQCGYKPDFAMVSPATFIKLAALFDPLKQYVFQTGISEVATAGGVVSLEGGVGAIKFDGCVFIEDPFCADNTIYYLNSRYIHMEYQDAALSLPFGTNDDAMMLGGLSDGFDTIPLGIVLELLAKIGDAQSAYLKCYPQLVVERPNAFGTRTAFT